MRRARIKLFAFPLTFLRLFAFVTRVEALASRWIYAERRDLQSPRNRRRSWKLQPVTRPLAQRLRFHEDEKWRPGAICCQARGCFGLRIADRIERGRLRNWSSHMNTDYVIHIATKRGRTTIHRKEKNGWTQTASTGIVRQCSGDQVVVASLAATRRRSARPQGHSGM